MKDLFDVLVPHWEAHQSKSEKNPLSIETRVRRIQKELDEFELQVGMDAMNLQGSSSPFQEQLNNSLLRFLNCAMASLVHTDNSSKEAAEAVLELTAAVAATNVDGCNAILERTTRLTETHIDNIRSAACSTIGWIVHYILHRKDSSDYNNLLDTASQALLPRFTDKTQSVRLAAILAGNKFFVDDATDPDLLQALLWCLQHDPSVANRVAAVESLPLTLETVDFVVQRVRDIKSKVRVATLRALREKCHDITLLDPIQCASIVEAGYTDRCKATKEATEELVCLGWMKLVKYDPLVLLRHLNVLEQESVCENVVSILRKATSNDSMLSELSDPEIRAFHEAMQGAILALSTEDENAPTSERLFLSIASIKHAVSQHSKDALLGKLVPDVSILCQGLERNTGLLIQAIEEKDEDLEVEYASVSAQLLQLAALADLEEGSRRLVSTALQRLLSSILAPDDLVEEAVKALKSVCRDDVSFIDQIAAITQEVDTLSDQNEELYVNHKLRVLSILTVLFEIIDPKQAGNPKLSDLSEFILPLVEDGNTLIREAAVSCVGKIGLFTPASRIQSDFEPLLLKVLLDENETQEIRGQAMLGLADWCLLHQIHPTFSDFISQALTRASFPRGMVCIAAEIATKLLLIGKTHNPDWIAALVTLLFDPSAEPEEDDDRNGNDVKQIGSPVRIHQILILFFPAYCLKFDEGSNLIDSVSAILESIFQRQQTLKKSKSRRGTGRKSSKTIWPLTKIVDYIVSTCEQAADITKKVVNMRENGEASSDSPDKESKDQGGEIPRERPTKSSPLLLAAIQVATYLEKKVDELSATSRRALCKWLGGVYIEFEMEFLEDLSRLKRAVDEVEMSLSDAVSSRALQPMIELLGDVPAEEEESENEEDPNSGDEQESLVAAFGQVGVTESPPTNKENSLVDQMTPVSKASDVNVSSNRRVSLESRSVN